MKELIYYSDEFDIAPYMEPEEKLGRVIDRMKEKPYTWRTWLRRAYVLTWPLSPLVRVGAFVVVGAGWLAMAIGGFTACRLAAVWHGKRTMWD